jgi:excisionase family DNA binding protein
MKEDSEFYHTSSYCKPCHNRRSLENRKQPHNRSREREAKKAWLQKHPEVNRRNVAAFRARQKALRAPTVIPLDKVLVSEAVSRLGVRKQRVQQLIDQGRLKAIKDQRGRWLIDRADLDRLVNERLREDEE